ncbi:MAG: DUF1801 domain-containing protein [Planctomycetes bacterium]|nr:DUF1801 domain-containing protein [Planctomycetota bacterium]
MKKRAVGTPADAAAVARFLAACGHPLRDVLLAAREVVVGAVPGLVEAIKWNAPSFRPDGATDDCLTFNLGSKGCVRLIFHRGAKAKSAARKGRFLAVDHGLLEWPADDRAVASFASVAAVAEAKPQLQQLVRQWVAAVVASDARG